ncbi:thioredoxin-like protein [Dactylonectria macrodidyma]|uniref:Thioredoxin-like protein n=1 Tax=Dactylonectria macrodidyma TaxID=307937 RepID=A0A9P9CYR6_9HYPO|nr:thioredoxin-like protein [Dactylonectria macrodidyma]
MASLLRKLFRRRKQPPLVCAVSLDDHGNPVGDDPNHVHTSACFIDFEPLAVVELFQSQGCQSCPPAIPGIQDGAAHPNLLLLTYNVTLFDHLGWKDTFAQASWDQRQRAYIRKWNRTSLFTPQVVVNGVADGSGATGKGEVQEIVGRFRNMQRAMDWHIYLDANDTDVLIDSDRLESEPHDILLVLYNSRDEVVKIGKGPNKGKKVNHRNLVTNIIKIGQWTGGNLMVPLPSPKSSMKPGEDAAILVQQGPGGPIVAVAKV